MAVDGRSVPLLGARWLGRALRDAREAAELTLKDAGAHLLRDSATLSKYETGRSVPRPADVAALLDLYGVTDPPMRAGLEELCRDPLVKGGQDAHAGRVPADWVDLAWVERRAQTIRVFDPGTVPALLRTGEFEKGLIRAADPYAPAEQVAARLEFQAARQRILTSDDRPGLSVVVDESVLYRPVGGAAVLRDQLGHLLTLSAEPGVTIRVCASASGCVADLGAFTIFDLPQPYTEVGYIGTLAGPVWAETDTGRFTRAWGRITEAAQPEEQSAELIKQAIAQ